ncbi:SIR2 family protein [Bacillus cereus]|uniref:SIR2 family NAD-dependent protein deacylase n=1 Tax=Bacillus cereus TaxID=1396 RepID=UPI000BF601EC|nr:SIR2 family protein [Bacillus cereus]PFF12189.1 SIR2 family protein [Bacillus cereus]PGN40844.1 SIR2 family protein [Bacillus cereus]PGN86866.1 SIR2 family protein [Bacillus cereus]
MSIKDVDKFFKDKLTMYPHLKVIRDNLWSKDGKSRVSVMVGAGFSLNATKIEDNFSGMALWNDLKYMLIKNLNHHLDIEYKDVLEIGQLYEEEYGRASLDEILKEAIPDENYESDLLHHKLLNLPWADIYTTNYDTLLERTKRNIYERNYQVIYDINDIPNSTSPRIIKLHGSFPSNRPFIFTQNDYDRYPEKFSPFVNMVQQSIMETTFVLLGFSGDDPNFERWTTWVKENLGEQMPKIYMIGYGQKNRLGYLKSKGITLIDFEEIYSSKERPYQEMFTDLFEFLSYKDREEKTKWPFKKYKKWNLSVEDLKDNRESFPGWIIMPNDIRRSNAESIRFFFNRKISDIKSLKNKTDLEFINEMLWCYEHFYIPLDVQTHVRLKALFDEISGDFNKNANDILLFLLKEARLDCNKEEFYKYKALLEKTDLNRTQYHKIIFEEVMFDLAFNNIDKVKSKLHKWQVGEKEIEWGIKKAAILIKIISKTEAKEILKGYLQTIRSLLAIQSDEYRLLSLESIALNLLRKINNERDYGYDRLRNLNLKNCNANKEFENTLISVKKYEYELGTKENPGFDPGEGKVSSKMGDYFKQELLDSFAVLQIEELFNLTMNDKSQYELSLKNLEIQYPLYSQIKRIHYLSVKEIDEFFSREFVYKLDDNNLEILLEMLSDTMEKESISIISRDVAIEIISRIYFALPQGVKLELDSKIISFMNNIDSLKNDIKKVLINLIKRIVFDKNRDEKRGFCEKLIELNVFSQWKQDETLYRHEFFEPILVVFSEMEDVGVLSVSEDKISEMFSYLKEDSDQSLKESALIRLTFLAQKNSLSKVNKEEFIKALKRLEGTREQGISDFIFSGVFDKIINSSQEISGEGIELYLGKDIPVFYKYDEMLKSMAYSDNRAVFDYFNEMYGIFPDYIGKKTRKLPGNDCYKTWLNKFYKWWDHQEDGLLRDIKEEKGLLPLPDYLQYVVVCLKNNILSVAPLEVFDDKDIEKLKLIFEKIDDKRPDLSLYLVPSFTRLKISNKYSFRTILDKLKSKEHSKVTMALHCIYDYLALIDDKEIELDSKLLKQELFNMLYYCTDDIFKGTVDTLKYCMKNVPNIFYEDDHTSLLEFLIEFLKLINDKIINISSLKDFELLSAISGLVAYLYQNAELKIKRDLRGWADYIKGHRLPEVRKYSDLMR